MKHNFNRNRRGGRRRGFTLVELMICIVIIGLLARLVVPSFNALRQQSEAARIVNDFKQLSGAFEVYVMENGNWPADVSEGVFPSEMEGYLGAHHFEDGAPAGGSWDWEGIDVNSVAGVSLRDAQVSDDEMEKVDEILDDGDLDTGRFQKDVVGTDSFTMILEGEP